MSILHIGQTLLIMNKMKLVFVSLINEFIDEIQNKFIDDDNVNKFFEKITYHVCDV